MEPNLDTNNVGNISYRESSWLTELLTQALLEPNGQLAKIMVIDIEKARCLMETNEDNRGLKRTVIDKINRDIRSERYYLNGETIVVSKLGKLLNGQHRLTSVIETGISIITWVIFGVPDECKTTFDQGTAKSAADFFKMMRVVSSKEVALVVKLLLIFQPGTEVTNKDLASRRISKQDILVEYESLEKPIQYALKTFGTSKYGKSMHAVAAITTAHVLISREIPKTLVDPFFDVLIGDGSGIERLNPILWARTKLSEILGSRSKFEASSEFKLQVILRTWNAWIDGKKVSHLKMDNIYQRIKKPKSNEIDSEEEE